jgi:hypothetical protein
MPAFLAEIRVKALIMTSVFKVPFPVATFEPVGNLTVDSLVRLRLGPGPINSRTVGEQIRRTAAQIREACNKSEKELVSQATASQGLLNQLALQIY